MPLAKAAHGLSVTCDRFAYLITFPDTLDLLLIDNTESGLQKLTDHCFLASRIIQTASLRGFQQDDHDPCPLAWLWARRRRYCWLSQHYLLLLARGLWSRQGNRG